MSFFRNQKTQKFISCLLILAVLSPAFIILALPKKTEATLPVFDLKIFWEEIKKAIKEAIKQFLMMVVRKLLDKMTQATINWINSGFRGKPLFIENPDSFFGDIVKTEIKNFVGDIAYDKVKFPFGKSFALGVIDDAKTTFDRNATYSLSQVLSDSRELEFRRNNFGVGGWEDFVLNTQFSQNNFFGFNLIASEELEKRTSGPTSPVQKVKDTVTQSLGFLEPQICKSNPSWSPEKLKEGYQAPTYTPPVRENGESDLSWRARQGAAEQLYNMGVSRGKQAFNAQFGCPEGAAKTTPGTVVAQQITKAMSSKFNQSELGAALGNSLAALFDALINHFMQKGLTLLTNFISPQDRDPSTVRVGDFNQYGSTTGGGYSGGYLGNPPTDSPEGTIVVNVSIINDNGGTLIESEIEIYIDGSPVNVGMANIENDGTHTVSAGLEPDYISIIGGDCAGDGSVTLSLGVQKICTVVFDDVASGGGGGTTGGGTGGGSTTSPQLTVTNTVINDNGGTLSDSDLDVFVDGNLRTSGVSYYYGAGDHIVSGEIAPGYTSVIGGDCDTNGNINLARGNVKQCSITYDDL